MNYAVYQNSYNNISNRVTPIFDTEDEADRYKLKYSKYFVNLEVKPFEIENQAQIRRQKNNFRRYDVRFPS